MRFAVAGGTGTVGRHVVDLARGNGHEVRVLSRSQGVDLTSGSGLDLAGVDVVVDVASVQTQSAKQSKEFFGTVTRNLLAAEAKAGVGHHLALSIVGIDRAPAGYYAGKMLQEELVAAGAVPWTILRATQFHEFAQQIHGQIMLGRRMLVPKMICEPVAAREVAEHLVALAEGTPAGRVADLGGPRQERMVEMVRAYARAIGDDRRISEIPLPGGFGKAMRDGSLTTTGGATIGQTTFPEWLTGRDGPDRH